MAASKARIVGTADFILLAESGVRAR